MPAKHAKELRGINTTIHESTKAFNTLRTMIDGMKVQAMKAEMFSQEDFDTLTDCLKTAERYLKHHFVYNLEEKSNVAQHCIYHCTSDPDRSEFASDCSDVPHTEKCENCEILPLLIQTLRGMLEDLRPMVDDNLWYGETLHDLLEAHEKIQKHISFIIMNEKSNIEWQKKYDAMNPERVMVTGKYFEIVR